MIVFAAVDAADVVVVVAAAAAAAAVDAAAVGDDVTQDLCLLRVHCLLNYHCHFYLLRHSYAQDENIVLKKREYLCFKLAKILAILPMIETRDLALPSSMADGGSLVVPAIIGAIML